MAINKGVIDILVIVVIIIIIIIVHAAYLPVRQSARFSLGCTVGGKRGKGKKGDHVRGGYRALSAER